MNKFADQLFEQLMREHGAALRALPEKGPAAAPARACHHSARPAWLTVGVAAATGAVAAGFVVFGGGATPAYAVTKNPDGKVSISISQASAVNDVNYRLKVLGERVAVVPVRPGCPNIETLSLVQHDQTILPQAVKPRALTSDGSVIIDARGVPDGDLALIAYDETRNSFGVGFALIKGAAPSCVSVDRPPAWTIRPRV